jgi:copper chaperone CopZ
MQRVSLRIEQMTCAGKSGWVNKTIGGLEGIGGCYADETTLTAVIDYDPAYWTPEKLIEKINTASEGFFTPTAT